MSGKFIFVGLSVGLAAFRMYDCKQVCVWDAVKTEICVICSSDLGNEHHVLLTVDEMGRCDVGFPDLAGGWLGSGAEELVAALWKSAKSGGM